MFKSGVGYRLCTSKLYPTPFIVCKLPKRAFFSAPILYKRHTPTLYHPHSRPEDIKNSNYLTKKSPLSNLLDNNAKWSKNIHQTDPTFFTRSAEKQSPKILWIGCSDSRVSAEQIVGAGPGELFVHRNIANLCVHTDLNCLSVIQYAVDVLKIEHIIVCGHYGCGGIAAAMRPDLCGLIDNWLVNIKDIYATNKDKFEGIEDQKSKEELLSELNVGNTVQSICHTAIVQQAWKRGQRLSVHGWIYGLEDGLINELGWCLSSPEQLESVYVYKNPHLSKRRRNVARLPKSENIEPKEVA